MNRIVHINVSVKCRTLPSFRFRPNRRAYTLIEALLALSLAGILLAGVFAAMEQSWRMSASGREEMERAQLARALVQRIETDIRSITYVAPPPIEETATMTTTTSTTSTSASGGGGGGGGGSNSSGGSNTSGGGSGGNKGGGTGKGSGSGSNSGGGKGGGGGGSGSGKSGNSGGNSSGNSNNSNANNSASDATSSTDGTTTEPPVPNSKPLGIRGTSQMLEITISRPRRELLSSAAAMSPTLKTSDLRDVTYSFSTTGSSLSSGLIRTEGDRMAVETVEANGGAANQISVGQAMAPEIGAISFRYFDGRQWLTSWDSDANGRVPRAVEVNFEFPPPRRPPPMFNIPVSPSMNRFRSVIAIPVSDPFPKEFAQ